MAFVLRSTLFAICGLLLLDWGTAYSQTTIRMEAENMQLDTMRVEAVSFASNSALINLKGPGFAGSASGSFPGPSGDYDIVVMYHDENDGEAQLSVSIDGTVVDSWTLDKLVSGGRNVIEANRFSRQIASGYNVSQSDLIEINALQGNWDNANVDYIEFSGSVPPPPPADNIAYVAKSGGNYDDPIEALNDSESWCKSPTTDAPCTLLIGAGRYELQQPLTTKDMINVVGTGQSATVLTRGDLPFNDCDLAQNPTISHISGVTKVTDLSIISECVEGGVNVEQTGGWLMLERVTIDSPDIGNSVVRTVAIRSTGSLSLDFASIHGDVLHERGSITIKNSDIQGYSEYHATISLSESTRAVVTNSQFSGIPNSTVLANSGDLEIYDSVIRSSNVGTCIGNSGTLLVSGTTFKGEQTTMISYRGNATVSHALMDSLEIPGEDYPGDLMNYAGVMLVTHTILRNIEILVFGGDLKCTYASDGLGNELGSDCLAIP